MYTVNMKYIDRVIGTGFVALMILAAFIVSPFMGFAMVGILLLGLFKK